MCMCLLLALVCSPMPVCVRACRSPPGAVLKPMYASRRISKEEFKHVHAKASDKVGGRPRGKISGQLLPCDCDGDYFTMPLVATARGMAWGVPCLPAGWRSAFTWSSRFPQVPTWMHVPHVRCLAHTGRVQGLSMSS